MVAGGRVGSSWIISQSFGGYGGGETPGPVPNPEAKPSSADGTALVRVWESRTPPNILPVKGLQLQLL